ncbi:ribosome biogenesis factor YjgA [Geoalkalibacter halelectricus]|uniref:ribosome biogenesis factor YjgA n=1 Tax=Geoalkalibacter halelectricus TaxID=2847045 RepID=UPI003D1D2E85
MERFEDQAPSRSAAKRQARHIEDLARRMLDVADSEARRLGWEAPLLEALRLARETRPHGARKRQTKHLAALLRRDEEAVAVAEEYLDQRDGRQREQVKDFHQLEQFRDALCAADAQAGVLDEILRLFPACDGQKLVALAAEFRATGERRCYREIFRLLRDGAEKGRP